MKASEAVETGPPVVTTGGSDGGGLSPSDCPPGPPGMVGGAVGQSAAEGTEVYAPQPMVDDPPGAVVGSKGATTPPQLQ